MNEPWPISHAWAGGFVLTNLWQSTLWLTAGLLASRLLRRHAARAHLALVLAMAAALISPVLTAAVRQMQWGVLPAAELTTATAVAGSEFVASPRQALAAETDMHDLGALQTDKMHGPKVDPITRPHELSHAPQPLATPTQALPAASVSKWSPKFREGLFITIAAAWIVCSLAIAIRLVAALLAGRRVVRHASLETHPKLLDALGQAAGALALRSEPVLRTSPAARCPMIWCWGRQPILVTPQAAAVQDGVTWLSVFCHELAHWLRRDHWSWLVGEAIVVVLPWHPLARRARHSLSFLREQACDDWVLAAGAEATDYAESLVNLVPQGAQAYALAAVRSRESLKRRLEHVLAGVRVAPAIERRWIAAAAVCAMAAATGVALAQQRTARPDEKITASVTPETGSTGKIEVLPAKEVNGDVVTIRGRVLKTDGQPAARARVMALRNYWTMRVKWRPVAVAIADDAGQFELSYRKSQFNDDLGSGADFVSVAAVADGFGVQWTTQSEIEASKPLMLKLAPDFPIHGRVVDLEGKPVEGVSIRLLQIRAPKEGEDLNPWLEAMKSGAMLNALSQKLGKVVGGYDDVSRPPISTDREGRFEITGIGAERDVRLELRGETIAYRQIDVATRDMQPLTRQLWFYAGTNRPPIKDQVFGANFTFQALPTKPIVGTVRDAATGKPIAGVGIESEHLAGVLVHPHNALRTQTDAQGRYRLVGMPKGNGPDIAGRNQITIVPNDEQPYFKRRIDVADSPGLAPVKIDLELRRGVWIGGRVTDKVTGKPVVSQMFYLPYRNNPFAKPPEFNPNANVGGDFETRNQTRTDGTFRIVGLPGPAIVAALAIGSPYRKGTGASEIRGMKPNGTFPTFNNPVPASSRFFNALKEINPAEDGHPIKCDFVLDPGGTIRLTVVDRDGKPVSGCSVSGRTQDGESGLPLDSSFDVTSLSPDESRQVAILNTQRNIGKFLVLKYDQKTPRAMTVTLEPCATLVGRLVDDDGIPFKGVELQASPAPGSYPWFFIPLAVCRSDGKFECRGLMPGCDYGLVVHGNEVKVQFPLKKIAIEPGKTIALGDIKLKRRPE